MSSSPAAVPRRRRSSTPSPACTAPSAAARVRPSENLLTCGAQADLPTQIRTIHTDAQADMLTQIRTIHTDAQADMPTQIRTIYTISLPQTQSPEDAGEGRFIKAGMQAQQCLSSASGAALSTELKADMQAQRSMPAGSRAMT
jgi:hypothetical protein